MRKIQMSCGGVCCAPSNKQDYYQNQVGNHIHSRIHQKRLYYVEDF